MPAPRDAIVKLCDTQLPETMDRPRYLHWGQVGFDNVAKDYGQGFGTTCGFLPHWLLWRFGCRDNTLVNRNEPAEGLSYRIGENLSIFQPGWKKPKPSWVALDNEQKTRDVANGKGPKPGDFVIIRGGYWTEKSTGLRTRDSAHIFVLLEVLKADGKKVTWRVAQSGVSNDAYQQGAHRTTLTGELREGEVKEGGQQHAGPNLVFVANILGEEPNFPRRVIGYCDLDKVAFGPAPAPRFLGMVDQRWTELADNQVMHIAKWLGWYEVASPGGFINRWKSYLVLDRGHTAYRLDRDLGPYRCMARGVWVLRGSRVEVTWEDGTRQSWTMASVFSPRVATTGTPISGNTGALTRVAQIPGGNPPPEVNAMEWRFAS